MLTFQLNLNLLNLFGLKKLPDKSNFHLWIAVADKILKPLRGTVPDFPVSLVPTDCQKKDTYQNINFPNIMSFTVAYSLKSEKDWPVDFAKL